MHSKTKITAILKTKTIFLEKVLKIKVIYSYMNFLEFAVGGINCKAHTIFFYFFLTR
jgi:hypothetical protein